MWSAKRLLFISAITRLMPLILSISQSASSAFLLRFFFCLFDFGVSCSTSLRSRFRASKLPESDFPWLLDGDRSPLTRGSSNSSGMVRSVKKSVGKRQGAEKLRRFLWESGFGFNVCTQTARRAVSRRAGVECSGQALALSFRPSRRAVGNLHVRYGRVLAAADT